MDTSNNNNSTSLLKKTCCSSSKEKTSGRGLKVHWDNTYTNNHEEKLGWFETDLSPSLQLINKTGLSKNSSILNVGAGNTRLVDKLLAEKYSTILATDISKIALKQLKTRVGAHNIITIVDDLTNPTLLNKIAPVDLWIDRAVLHFFTKTKEQDAYFKLLKSKINLNGFVLLAEFNLQGAEKCSGLPVQRYSAMIFEEKLGSSFKLIETFDYTYTMPSGNKREYVYALFQKKTI